MGRRAASLRYSPFTSAGLCFLSLLLLVFLSYCQGTSSRPFRARIAEENTQLLSKRKYRESGFVPEAPAAPFVLPTLQGKFVYSTNNSLPLLFNVFNPLSGVSDCLWKETSYIDDFLTTAPLEVDFLFLSYSNSSETLSDVVNLRRRIDGRLRTLNITEERRSKLKTNIHYVIAAALELQNWVSDLLKSWSYPLSQLVITADSEGRRKGKFEGVKLVNRLDARYDWLPSPISLGNQAFEVVYLDNSCQLPAPGTKNFTNRFVLAQRSDPCSFAQKVTVAQKIGSSGLIVFADEGQNLVDMNCVDQECNVLFNIPATMISYEDGIYLKNLISKEESILVSGENEMRRTDQQQVTKISFSTTDGQPLGFGIQDGKIKEIGWFLFPSLQFNTFQAQWFVYASQLKEYIEITKPITTEILIFDAVTLFKTPVSVPVAFNQSLRQLLNYDSVELDLSLSCPGTSDSECPPWDRVLAVSICCENSGPLCGQELGRYITPFRRRIGRWITPITSQMPLFTSNKCNFTIGTDPWILKPWQPTLRLRLMKFSEAVLPKEDGHSVFHLPKKSSLSTYQIIPLFSGGVFDQTYNNKFKPIQFQLSSITRKVELVSIITGHGSDNNNCGEFCVTSHHFWVNKRSEVSRSFDNAGTPMGCALAVPYGSVPNEHGTWLYGRDGWCDGQNVLPWVVDITHFLNDPSQANEIWYQGYFNGSTPHPTSNPGSIIMSSWLVYWTDSQ
eukprot:TRINITY_DN1517_c0_g2_i3.p1 TRINITY_DN1517_c0_g2~~TRINITY_DN1517_c0_g2_i3.p1  ORF type:complete len:743 (-),score=178.62 TRINITY_DN1517_c0_g2_i3:1527-3713(-)